MAVAFADTGAGPGELLDDIAATVFAGEAGAARLEPLLAHFDDAVGRVLDDDLHRETQLAIRVDWALCDAPIDGGDGEGEGDTWLRRALAGEVPGVQPDRAWESVVGTYVGVFEVWPLPTGFLRDRVGGLSLALANPGEVEALRPLAEEAPGRPAALWEVRVLVDDDGAHLCRAPLPYPLELVSWLEDRQVSRFAPGGAPTSLMRLRRRWLQFSRARQVDPMAIFGL